MSKIGGYTEIYYEGKDITYTFCSLFNNDLCTYAFPSLSFVKDYGMSSEKHIEIWDNDRYLKGILYDDVLLSWVIEKKINSAEEFTHLLKIEGVCLEDFQGIYDLITKAIELKML